MTSAPVHSFGGTSAKLAEEMIAKHSGKKNKTLPQQDADSTFDDPPFCTQAENFCSLLAERKFKKAHALLAPSLQQTLPLSKLKEAWLSMVGSARPDCLSVSLEGHMLDWPTRKKDEVGWCYFAVSGEDFAEAVNLVVAQTPFNGYWITEIEFGRP